MSLGAIARRLWDRFWIELDVAKWRRQTRALRRLGTSRPNRIVLFCDLMTMTSTAKVEALFAAALAYRNCQAVVLLRDRYAPILKIFAACSNVRFVFLNERLTDAVMRDAATRAESLIGASPDLDALVDLEVDGFRTGRNVHSWVVRKFRVGRLDVTDPEQLAELRSTLTESLAVSRIARNIIAEIAPDHAVFLEKGYTPAGEVYDACLLAGIDTVQWCGAPQDNHFLFKRYRLATRAEHPFALGDAAWAEICSMSWGETEGCRVVSQIASHYRSDAWYNRQQLQVGKRIMEADEVRERLGLRPGRRVAVIFAHILYDATFFYGSSLYPDYERWLVETVRGAIANPELDWVVKVHPVNIWRSRMDGAPMEQLEAKLLHNEFGELPKHVRLMAADTDVNTFSLFSAIDFGITVRGTIGIELPCFSVPVVTAGTGRYSGRGFTIDPPDVRAYQAVIAKLHEYSPLTDAQVELARKYAYAAFFKRPYPMHSFKLTSAGRAHGVAELQQTVRLDEPALMDAVVGGDLAGIAEFVVDGRPEDLLGADSTVTP